MEKVREGKQEGKGREIEKEGVRNKDQVFHQASLRSKLEYEIDEADEPLLNKKYRPMTIIRILIETYSQFQNDMIRRLALGPDIILVEWYREFIHVYSNEAPEIESFVLKWD